MATDYTSLIGAMAQKDGVFTVTIPDNWMQGRTTYGGLTAALSLEAILKSFPDLPPLRSAQISFIGPAGGQVEVAPTLLRQGKSVTFAGADLIGAKGLAARSVFAFGADRPSRFDENHMPTPDLPDPEECEIFLPEGMGPPFAEHYEQYLAKGGRPMSGSSAHDHFIWVRHRDRQALSISALLALADMPPPAMMPKFTEPAPVSSMTWHLNFLSAAPVTDDGWWLLQSRAENASAGYSSQDMLVWNYKMQPVIAGRQSVAIFT